MIWGAIDFSKLPTQTKRGLFAELSAAEHEDIRWSFHFEETVSVSTGLDNWVKRFAAIDLTCPASSQVRARARRGDTDEVGQLQSADTDPGAYFSNPATGELVLHPTRGGREYTGELRATYQRGTNGVLYTAVVSNWAFQVKLADQDLRLRGWEYTDVPGVFDAPVLHIGRSIDKNKVEVELNETFVSVADGCVAEDGGSPPSLLAFCFPLHRCPSLALLAE